MKSAHLHSSAEPESSRIARVSAAFEAHRHHGPSTRAEQRSDVIEVPCELAPGVLRRTAGHTRH